MPNPRDTSKPGSAKHAVIARYPRAICQRFNSKEYRVFTGRRPLMQIGIGTSAELAWHNANGTKPPSKFPG